VLLELARDGVDGLLESRYRVAGRLELVPRGLPEVDDLLRELVEVLFRPLHVGVQGALDLPALALQVGQVLPDGGEQLPHVAPHLARTRLHAVQAGARLGNGALEPRFPLRDFRERLLQLAVGLVSLGRHLVGERVDAVDQVLDRVVGLGRLLREDDRSVGRVLEQLVQQGHRVLLWARRPPRGHFSAAQDHVESTSNTPGAVASGGNATEI
jgi:hypothetical protein